MRIKLMAAALAVLAALAACDTRKKPPENVPRPRASGAGARVPADAPAGHSGAFDN